MLTVIMVGAIHFHMTQLGDSVDKLMLQFALLAASVAIMLLSKPSSAPAAKKSTRRTASSRKKTA
jgi:hypothetical protein